MITVCIPIWCNTIYFVDAVKIRAGSLGTDCLHSASLQVWLNSWKLDALCTHPVTLLAVVCLPSWDHNNRWLPPCDWNTSFQQEDWDSKVNTRESRMDILDFSWHIFVWCYCVDHVDYKVGPGPRKRIETLHKMRASRSMRESYLEKCSLPERGKYRDATALERIEVPLKFYFSP